MTVDERLRIQWNLESCFKTSSVSPKLGTHSGLRSSRMKHTSLSATVIPPPVNGCRIFSASPKIIKPGVLFDEAGRKEFGIDRNWPLSNAASNEARASSGSEGKIMFRRWPLTPPFFTDAEGRFSGISTRIRVSRVPIWYMRTGGLSLRSTWP